MDEVRESLATARGISLVSIQTCRKRRVYLCSHRTYSQKRGRRIDAASFGFVMGSCGTWHWWWSESEACVARLAPRVSRLGAPFYKYGNQRLSDLIGPNTGG